MGIDQTDDGDVAATPGDAAGGGGDQRVGPGGQVEGRDRESYRAELSAAVDPPGSWRGESNRYLDASANGTVEARCDRVAKTEGRLISPGVLAVEGQDAGRGLVGFEHRLKGRDRIKDKVAEGIEERGRTADEALSLIPDAIRYTFQYEESHYSRGVREDIGRMNEQGFELVKLKNLWADDQYKGVNSQWREPSTGQRFELQFHTRISFEAKQLTHGAYERLRSGLASAQEEIELEDYQREVSAKIPIPPGVDDISEHGERGRHAG